MRLSPKRLGAGLRELSKISALVLAAVVYSAFVAAFAVVYSIGGMLVISGRRAGLGDALYFSVVNQATVGFGDVLPTGSGGSVVVAQIAVGVIWSAFVPALVVYRLLLPSERDL